MKGFIVKLIILYISTFFIYVVGASNIRDQIFIDGFIRHELRKCDEKKVTPLEDNREPNFYISTNFSRIYSDNLELFMSSVRVIGEKILILIKGGHCAPVIKNVIEDGIRNIDKFNDKVDFHWINSLSLGYYTTALIKNSWIDFENVYFWIDTNKGDNSIVAFDRSIRIFAFLLNFYYNPNIIDLRFTPYIGFGIGSTVFDFERISPKFSNLIPLNIAWFIYQFRLGVNYSIVPSRVKTFLSYRYLSIPIPVLHSISIHNVEVGLVFDF
ncbi:MAG: P44/Msp2 family outer membrane protein [Wolbachia endosymbiont of Menacanthus eurysternus]|nr:MAG: P44/Msp2 family outer membrane protein [Wolbachia endosymbiont of Menacanthus eurysternus]